MIICLGGYQGLVVVIVKIEVILVEGLNIAVLIPYAARSAECRRGMSVTRLAGLAWSIKVATGSKIHILSTKFVSSKTSWVDSLQTVKR